MKNLGREFIDQCVLRINEYTDKVFSCLDELDEEEIWRRPNEASNSGGNIILHLCGNIRQYIISSLGRLPDNRERDKEFSAKGGYTKSELKRKLRTTVDDAIKTIEESDEDILTQIRSVQGFTMTGVGIILHVTEHYSYHTGQIIFWTKFLKNKDLGFYVGFDLNRKNKND